VCVCVCVLNNIPLYRVGHTMVALPDGDILAIGGMTESGDQLASVEQYQRQAVKDWKPVQALPFSGWLGGAVVVGNDDVLYCAGDWVNKCAKFSVSLCVRSNMY
jgi:hypothetical protein